MGTMLESLLNLQAVERQLAQVRRRLRSRENAANIQQKRIDQIRSDWEALHQQSLERRKEADRLSLDLKEKEDQVVKLRTSLNTARTNKEYSAILTQINTFKADNSRVEEDALRVIQEAESIQGEATQLQGEIDAQQERLGEIRESNQDEVARLNHMMEGLERQRDDATKSVSPEALAIFERIGESYDGESMAVIEVHGRKPPHQYVCGGCFMSLNAEHANALRVRDEIRTCDNCGRILYLPATTESTSTK
jgi:uncharacterized protein